MTRKALWTSVTKGNFSEVLPQVQQAIIEADFLAFDTELTGLHLTRGHRNSVMDDLSVRYGKLRESVSNFGLLQVGLGCFKWSDRKQKYAVTAFSFYVFPSAANGVQQDRKFTCQLGSLSFLAEHKFDFNKAFHDGIPFITKREESVIKANSAFYSSNDQGKTDSTKPLIMLKDDEKAFVGEILTQIDEWMKDEVGGEGVAEGATDPKRPIAFDLPHLNSYQRLIFYQQIPLVYGDKLAITKKAQGILSIRRADSSPEAKAAALAEEKAQFDRALEDQVGFRRVIDCIVENGKPVIGHNCWVDLLHFYHKFIDVLPQSVSSFKEEITKTFPCIVDTKYLARLASITDNSLSDLAAHAAKFPEMSFFAEEKRSEKKKGKGKGRNGDSVDEDHLEASDNHFHDAGFDAICTGQAFLAILEHDLKDGILQACSDPKSMINLKSYIDFVFEQGQEGFSNRLNVMQSDYDYMNLRGIDLEPSRSSTIHICGLPSTVVLSDIQSALNSLVPEMKLHFQVHCLNDSSCFVQFEMEEMARDVLTAFSAVRDSQSKWTKIAPNAAFLTYLEYQERRDSADQSFDRKRSKFSLN